MIREQTNCVVLVLGADDNYALPMAVTLYSALTNLAAGWSVDLYLIDGGIEPVNKNRIERIARESAPSVTLHWKTVDASLLTPLPQTTGKVVNAAAYLRLFIPQLLREQYKRVIYLDCDLIIRSSLSDLWNIPFDGDAILAVQDYWIPYVSSDLGIEKHHELGIPPNSKYFNTGVLVINLPYWREQKVRKQVFNYLVVYKDYRNFNDQEGLNVVLSSKWKSLALSWNVPHIADSTAWRSRLALMNDTPLKEAIKRATLKLPEHAHIIHYASASKPWKRTSHYPLQHLWYRYFWESGWLSPQARLVSRAKFYARYFLMAAAKAVREGTRPTRHWLSAYAPKAVRRLLRKD